MKNIVEFLDKEKIVVKPIDIKLKQGGEGFNTYGAFNFPDEPIAIIKLEKNGDELLYLTFFSNKTSLTRVTVPKDFKVNKIYGKERVELLKQYEEHFIKDLHYNLGHGFHIGSDPEIFVVDNKNNVIPAFDFLGSKEKPDKTAGSVGRSPGECGNNPMYWDGFQAEFVTHAVSCLAWQVDSVQCGLKGVLQAARKHNPKAKLSIKTVVDIPFELLRSSKDEHVQFGCMPSMNAYDMKGNGLGGREVPFRPAGGHIHFGIGKLSKEEYIKIVKGLDAILGVACVSLFAKFDNPKRRMLYGLAGEYRTPPHGLEYRVLSNAWLSHPLIMNTVFDIARKVVVFSQNNYMKYWNALEKETIDCINNCDVKKARNILDRNKAVFIKIIEAAYNHLNKQGAEAVFNMFKNGMESVVKDPSDIEGNWDLTDKVNGASKWISHSDGKGKNMLNGKELLIAGKKVA